MNRVLPLLTAVLALSGCGWNHLPAQGERVFSEPLWDAQGTIARTDGLYVPLPVAGALAHVTREGSALVDLGPDAQVSRILPAPDDSALVVFVSRVVCDMDDEEELDKVVHVEDCAPGFRQVEIELSLVREGLSEFQVPVPQHLNALAWSEDGSWAIAYTDGDLQSNGIVDLTSVMVIDMLTGETHKVSVGFAADRVLFTHEDDMGNNPNKAVVLSHNSVAVVDLDLDVPATEVTFPLTLDADQTVTPVGVELTPDNRYALISVKGAGDLYVLDLENRSVNMVTLSDDPSAMLVDSDVDRTVLVYSGGAVADILEHDYFDIETVQLDEPMSQIVDGNGFSLLYNSSDHYAYHDVYRLDLQTGDLLEYRMQNPVMSLHLAPSEEYAVALTRAEGSGGSGIEGQYDSSPGMEIIDLRDPDKARSTPYLLEQPGVGLAYSDTATALHILLLQQNVDYLYQLDLYTGAATELDLDAPPVAIGSMPEGGFYITHEAGMGHITFYDPVTGELSEAFGFATLGLFDETDIASVDDDEEVE